MHSIVIALIAAIVAIVLYRWYMSKENAENGPSPSPSPPTSGVPKPTMSGSDFGGTTGKQVYLMDGTAVTTDANGTKAAPDATTNMTVNAVEDRRRQVLNPLERSRKSQRALSDKLLVTEMTRNADGKKMMMGDEDEETMGQNDNLDCIQSILAPDDIIPGYIPGRRTLVALAMSE